MKKGRIDYDWLYGLVRQRFASADALEAFLPTCRTPDELRTLDDSRYLSAMTQRIFRAGMTHKVVDARWPAFEQAFFGFVPEKMVLLSPDRIEVKARDPQLIRHLTKMRTIPLNAQMILDVRKSEGRSIGSVIADWPLTDITGLWRWLAKRAERLGGNSAAGFLRIIGKDTFILSPDSVARLRAEGVVDGQPSSRADIQRVQEFFDDLHEKSGRPYCQLSAMLSLSINPRF